MENTLTNPLPFDQFKLDVESAKIDIAKILSWANHDVYILFIRYASGDEEPMTINGCLHCHINASYIAGAQQALASIMLNHDDDHLVVKPVSIDELFSISAHYKLSITIRSEDDSLCLAGRAVSLLSHYAIYDDSGNEGKTYEVTAFPFETADSVSYLPRGAVQLWESALNEYRLLSGQEKALYIFDDRLDWTNPLFPTLPDNAKPLSTLSAQAQGSFKRMQLSPSLINRSNPKAPTAPDAHYQNSLLNADKLTGFRRIRAMVDKDVVAYAANITLTVTSPATHDAAPGNSKCWEIQISFISPMGFNVVFAPDLVDAELCKANTMLPNTTGTHRANKQLRERIVTHLAWMLFQHGRGFDYLFSWFHFDLKGLLPGSITNGRGNFQPDYADERFPCLAHFQFGEHHVPVLLLGADKDNYICMPLSSPSLQEADVPIQIPHRSDLVCRDTRLIELKAKSDMLAIPTALIAFPDDYYQGVRVSSEMIKDKFCSRMRHTELPENVNQQFSDNSSPLMWLLGCCAVAALFVILDMVL